MLFTSLLKKSSIIKKNYSEKKIIDYINEK